MMGVGFYLTEELRVEEGKVLNTGTWDYKPPTADNIPQHLHVEFSNTKANRNRILSSKGVVQSRYDCALMSQYFQQGFCHRIQCLA